jgi:iron complex outermembrane receptor protein
LAALAAAFAPASHADEPPSLAPVVVTATRVEHNSFDLPAAIDVIGAERITEGQARVNASESLVAVPGLVVQNRQNYAQDLQISSRGFGARSAFGVRGVRLLADGIPATMPDGQGQAATFNLDMAERIEVLRGPYSAIYGNHAGGVIQLFTRDGAGSPKIEAGALAGSYGSWKADINAQGEANGIGYVLDTSRFSTDGYRDHSAATRDQAFAKLSLKPDADSRLVVTANGLRQDDTQDPLGLTWAGVQRNPRGVDAAAISFNTRKSIDHVQGGASYERRFGDSTLHLSAYAGNRQVIQYQAIPASAQANPKHSGGVVDFDRDFGGFGARWTDVRKLASGKLSTTVGLDYDRSRDDRRGYENFIGATLGVKGRLRRDERDIVTSVDPYVQTEWQGERWIASAGLRHSRVRVEVDDNYLSNGNDSGSITYSRTTPVLGLTYKLMPAVRLYASAARGFETPTLNELFYSGAAGGFNFNLKPSRSTHVETGVKTILGEDTSLNVALFQVKTEDELVVDVASGGRTSYRNASRTLRRGVEVALDTAWAHGFSGRLALTGLHAVYDQASGAIAEGNRLPGVPSTTLYGELAWKSGAGYSAGLEAIANSKVYVEDSNAQHVAPGYAIANLRVGAEQRAGQWRLKEFARLNNLFDRNYIGSVIVGDANGRYYEPAPGRNWMVGASAQYAF